MDIENIATGLRYHTTVDTKKTYLEDLLKTAGFLSPRQRDMKNIYIDKITYHTIIEKPSIVEQIEKSLNIK